MKKKVIIWSGIALIAGVGVYFLVKKFRKPPVTPPPPPTPPGNEVTPPAGDGTGNDGGAKPPAELDTKAKVLAFQQWVINTKKDKTILGSGGASGYGDDGIWKSGGKTDAAWTKYGAEYKTSAGSGGSAKDPELEKAINLILGKASNAKGKATRSYLTSASPDFVKTWAWNIDNDRSAFGWSNGIWRVKTGEQLLTYNPIGDSVKTKSDAVSVHETASSNSSHTTVSKAGNSLGTVKAVKFDGTTVWFYVPEYSTVYKWVMSRDIKKG